ncbi:MAG: hypothetical protein HXY24_10550 [Rubrivivax sp.]|nr:hypothetical protein [Rubrivivax sp.]
MQAENVKEYELIRGEMITVKDCITRYIGYVFGGSGAAIYGMARMEKTPISYSEMVLIAFSLATIISFVLLILYYKFYSHNRFAGYCKLLNHERYDTPLAYKNFLSWEIAVGRLRDCETDLESYQGLIKKVKIQNLDNKDLQIILEEYIGKNPNKDKNKKLKGVWFLIKALFGYIKTSSWGFPPYVVAMFCILSFSFLITGIYLTHEFVANNPILKIGSYIVEGAQFLLWRHLSGKLYSLINGTATVNAFYMKFIPIRATFLNEHYIIPKYIFNDEMMKEIDRIKNSINVKKT